MPTTISALTKDFAKKCDALTFSRPVTHVYNPLIYANRPHTEYLNRYASKPKKVLFIGMNPGPWGMAQSGIPFGDVQHVREWIKIEARVDQPKNPNSKRPVHGFACPRREISGKRLWGLFRKRFPNAEDFFEQHLVMNYCPLLFSQIADKRCINITPDKLIAAEREQLYQLCDNFLQQAVRQHIKPQYLVAVGNFAQTRLRSILPEANIVKILHPSPANPKANKDFDNNVTQTLQQAGIWQ